MTEEVLTHLRGENVNLAVRLEIEATDPDGFEEARITLVRRLPGATHFSLTAFL